MNIYKRNDIKGDLIQFQGASFAIKVEIRMGDGQLLQNKIDAYNLLS